MTVFPTCALSRCRHRRLSDEWVVLRYGFVSGEHILRRGVAIVDTFAEAFGMRAARVVITARSIGWARTAAQCMTGFATSVIGCKIEAGIEADLLPEETPDGRPGVSVLIFGFDA